MRCFLLLLLLALGRPDAFAQAPEVQPATSATVLSAIQDAEAHIKVVNMWATWCAPCRAEFPAFMRLGREFADQGVAVLFVSADFESALPEVQAFLAEQGVRQRTFLKTESDQVFVNAFHEAWTGALPATFIYDEADTLVAFWEGETTFEALSDRVGQLLASQP